MKKMKVCFTFLFLCLPIVARPVKNPFSCCLFSFFRKAPKEGSVELAERLHLPQIMSEHEMTVIVSAALTQTSPKNEEDSRDTPCRRSIPFPRSSESYASTQQMNPRSNSSDSIQLDVPNNSLATPRHMIKPDKNPFLDSSSGTKTPDSTVELIVNSKEAFRPISNSGGDSSDGEIVRKSSDWIEVNVS